MIPEPALVKVRILLVPQLLQTLLLFVALHPQLASGDGNIKHTAEKGSEANRQKKHCPEKHDPHGVWEGSTAPGGEYTLKCDGGYEVDGQTTMTLTCSQEYGQWNADPWCRNVDDCKKRRYGCGPAGRCVDEVGWSRCECEKGAIQGESEEEPKEVLCYFNKNNKNTTCHGRNCGPHGVCMDLIDPQPSFDSGSNGYRCSCDDGYYDNDQECVRLNCGELFDPEKMGTWHGDHHFEGEYTLMCNEGAHIYDSVERANTITCGKFGKWEWEVNKSVKMPRCVSPAKQEHEAHVAEIRFWSYLIAALACVCGAALAAGLTMGLVSLEPREMEIITHTRLEACDSEEQRERLQKQKQQAATIQPVLKDHHLLLVTLLLLNALANEALPIFLDNLVSPFFAVLLSVTFVLMCGEILPSALFTGPQQLEIAALFVPLVKVIMTVAFPIAKPIAMALDKGLPHKSAEDELYTRSEIRAILTLHSQVDQPVVSCARSSNASAHTAAATLTHTASATSRHGLLSEPSFFSDGQGFNCDERCRAHFRERAYNCFCSGDRRDPETAQEAPPLDGLEAMLCFSILDMGETKVEENNVFKNLRRCGKYFHQTVQSTKAADAASECAAAGAQAVVVCQTGTDVEWPCEVPLGEIIGVLRLPELLADEQNRTLTDITGGKGIAQVQHDTMTIDALVEIAKECGTPCGFAVVIKNHEFAGILDGEEVLAGLLRSPDCGSPPAPAPQALTPEAAQAVQTALAGRSTGSQEKPLEGLLGVGDGSAAEIQRVNGNSGSVVGEQGDGTGTKVGVSGHAASVPSPPTNSTAAPPLLAPESGDNSESPVNHRRTC